MGKRGEVVSVANMLCRMMWAFLEVDVKCWPKHILCFFSIILVMHCLFQAKELQTLHNLRKLFVQDLQARVKKVQTFLT